MLRIGICDDEPDMSFDLLCQLERFLEGRGTAFEIQEFVSGDALLDWYGRNAGLLDLVFLDIEMAGHNGMATARELRRQDKSLQIVFVTGHPDYVFDGYSVGALGYLMKPAQAEQLADVVVRAMAALHLEREAVYYLRNSEGTFRIPKAAILYFVNEKRRVTCVTEGRSYTYYAKLDEVEKEAGPGFLRIHQRYIVNPLAVERIAADSVVIAGTALPISRSYKKEALTALTQALLD